MTRRIRGTRPVGQVSKGGNKRVLRVGAAVLGTRSYTKIIDGVDSRVDEGELSRPVHQPEGESDVLPMLWPITEKEGRATRYYELASGSVASMFLLSMREG